MLKKTRKSCRYLLAKDLSYYGKQTPSQLCSLDICYPEEASEPVPAVVWFHGGGMEIGEKELPKELTGQGIAVFGMGYRLRPQANPLDIIKDAAAGIAWVFQNAKKFNADPGKIYLSGHSAGCYLALLCTLDKTWLAPYKLDPDRLAGVVSLSGQTITHLSIRAMRGIPPERPVIDELAPLYHVRGDAPPIILVTGDRELDIYGRYEENAYLYRMLKVNNHKRTELIEIKGKDHGGMITEGLEILLRHVTR